MIFFIIGASLKIIDNHFSIHLSVICLFFFCFFTVFPVIPVLIYTFIRVFDEEENKRFGTFTLL